MRNVATYVNQQLPRKVDKHHICLEDHAEEGSRVEYGRIPQEHLTKAFGNIFISRARVGSSQLSVQKSFSAGNVPVQPKDMFGAVPWLEQLLIEADRVFKISKSSKAQRHT